MNFIPYREKHDKLIASHIYVQIDQMGKDDPVGKVCTSGMTLIKKMRVL